MGSLSTSSNSVRSVAVDAQNPKRVYAAGPAGLFRSDDAGVTWATAGKGLTSEPLAVAAEPTAAQIVFTALADGSAWRSNDGAATWQRMAGA